jgi:twinkle protein
VFNKTTGGLRPREFSILCGGTGVGKTTYIANLSASLIKGQTPHYVASVETGSLDYVRRILSVYADKDINTGDPIEKKEIFSLHKRFKHLLHTNSLQLALYENRTTVEELMSDITHAHDKYGTKVAMIDNLNFFMEITSDRDAIREMDRVMHEMIIFCKNVDVHIIMVMHPKKTDHGRVESEFDIKGSSLAVQEAHNIFLLNRPKDEDIESGQLTRFDRELKIAKMRRKGRAVGRKIFFKSENGVSYQERGYVD